MIFCNQQPKTKANLSFYFENKYCLIEMEILLNLLKSGVKTGPKSKQDRNRRGETECWKHNCSLVYRSGQYQGAKMGKEKVQENS